MVYLPSDLYVGQALEWYGEYSEGEMELLRQVVQPTWTIVEVGANQGALTIPLAKLASRVIAFEPQPLLAGIVRVNAALNGLSDKVAVYPWAIGNRCGTAQIPVLDYNQTNNYGAVEVGQGDEQVPITTLDNALAGIRPELIKIDAEGMEQEVIEGALTTITHYRPVLYFENDRKERAKGLIDLVRSLGYQPFWWISWLYNKANFAANEFNLFDRVATFNVIALYGTMKVTGLVPVMIGKEAPEHIRDQRRQ